MSSIQTVHGPPKMSQIDNGCMGCNYGKQNIESFDSGKLCIGWVNLHLIHRVEIS
jgi:hypothetical protein